MITAAVIGFLLGMGFGLARLSYLAGQATHISALALLGAFGLLLLAGLLQISRLVLTSIRAYFSRRNRSERKLLYYLNQHRRLSQLFQLKKARILYDSQQKRKRLLQQNGKSSVSL